MTNELIISLAKDLDDAKAEVERIESRIEELQKKCAHEDKFSFRDMYEDCYTCTKCGRRIWK